MVKTGDIFTIAGVIAPGGEPQKYRVLPPPSQEHSVAARPALREWLEEIGLEPR